MISDYWMILCCCIVVITGGDAGSASTSGLLSVRLSITQYNE